MQTQTQVPASGNFPDAGLNRPIPASGFIKFSTIALSDVSDDPAYSLVLLGFAINWNRYSKTITASDSESEVPHVQASDWESLAVAILCRPCCVVATCDPVSGITRAPSLSLPATGL